MAEEAAASATDVQPQGGQGDPGQGDAPYAPYLSSIPEHLRGQVEPAFKKWDSDMGKKFQEHATYRQAWEPYEALGVDQVDPEVMHELMQFHEIAQDPESFQEWWQAIGEHFGFGEGPEGEGFDEGDEGGMPDVNALVQEAVQQAISPFQQQQQEQEYAQALASETQTIQSELDALKQQHGDFDQDRVIQMAMAYEDDPQGIQRAHQDYMNLVASVEQGLLSRNGQKPQSPVQGGRAASSKPEIKTFADANAAARELIRGSQQ